MSEPNFNYPFGLPLKTHFSEFVYYEGFFLPHEVDRIRGYWDDHKVEKATVHGDQKYRDDLRQSSVMFIESGEACEWLYRRLGELAIVCNNERYWFDLLGFHQEFQLTRYDKGHFFDWHMDFGPGAISHRKLSLTVQLSAPEEYEGGELQFMINQKVVSAPKTKGTVVIFPSFVLHRVSPVTKGIRQSIVGWVSGPPYR